jgi:hypothetical protein
MKTKNANDLKNTPFISDFLSNLLGEIKKGDIQPLTDDEPRVLQEISAKIFKKLNSETIEASLLRDLSKELFLTWRGNAEIGLTIMCDFPKTKSVGSKGVTVRTSVDYGFSCRKYSDFEKKLNTVKKQQEQEIQLA